MMSPIMHPSHLNQRQVHCAWQSAPGKGCLHGKCSQYSSLLGQGHTFFFFNFHPNFLTFCVFAQVVWRAESLERSDEANSVIIHSDVTDL